MTPNELNNRAQEWLVAEGHTVKGERCELCWKHAYEWERVVRPYTGDSAQFRIELYEREVLWARNEAMKRAREAA